ncbi:hypothetical protein BJY52DRAFT_1225666 [Lactarius psammicola]|nr:hypothetical protein BJY52DRAFT_1225666 [Lactarius psammicola]
MSSQLPLPFTLRPNRNAHPGFIDKPQARRSTENVQAERAAKEKEKLAKVQSRQKTIEKTAQVESGIRQAHEQKIRHRHNPPPVVINRVLRTRPLSGSNNGNATSQEKEGNSGSRYSVMVGPPAAVKEKRRHQQRNSGLFKDWKERHLTSVHPLSDNGLNAADMLNESGRSSSVGSRVSASSPSWPATQVNTDEELGGLSEGNTDGNHNERSEIDTMGPGVTTKGPRALQRSYARIIPTTSIPVPAFAPPPLDLPRAKEKIRLGHLPTHLVLPFDTIFAPHLRTIFRKTAPWETPADEDIKRAWAIIFPEERALEFHTPLGVIIQKLVLDRLSSWRHNLGNAGILALQKRVFPSLPTDGVGTTALEVRSEWCTWAISRTEENHPFYFAEVIEDVDGNVESQSGIFQSRMISAVLGSYINGIAPLQINTKTDRPIGTLVLAIQSAKRAITFHMTGVVCKPPRPAADFSKANWGDHTKYDANGHPTSVYPTSTLVDLIKQLKSKQWEKILSAAAEASKVNLNTEGNPITCTSSNGSTSGNRLKLQLRDDDSDISSE